MCQLCTRCLDQILRVIIDLLTAKGLMPGSPKAMARPVWRRAMVATCPRVNERKKVSIDFWREVLPKRGSTDLAWYGTKPVAQTRLSRLKARLDRQETHA